MTGLASDVRTPGRPCKTTTIMAASAAMIVAGVCAPRAWAQDAGQAASLPPPSHSLVLVNQIQQLRDQMQHMQGEIELLQHKLQQLQQTSKVQYVDVDSRLGKLEQAQAVSAGPSTTPSPSSSAKPAPASTTGSTSDLAKAAEQADFDAAFKSLRAGNYVDSARAFRAFIGKYPDSPMVPNAYYWLGSSYQVTQNYKPALTAFETLLRKYPDSPKVAETQLRVADCQIALKDYAAARATLQAIIKAHPHTSLEKRARDRMQDIPASSSAK